MVKALVAIVGTALGAAVGFNLLKSDSILHAAVWKNPVTIWANEGIHGFAPPAILEMYGVIFRNCVYFPYAFLTGALIGIACPRMIAAASAFWISYAAIAIFETARYSALFELPWYSMFDNYLCTVALIPAYIFAARAGRSLIDRESIQIDVLSAFVTVTAIGLMVAGGVASTHTLVSAGVLTLSITAAIKSRRKEDEQCDKHEVAEP